MGSLHSIRRCLLAALGLLGSPLLAAPAEVVHMRVSGLRELGAAFKAVNDTLHTGQPQVMLIRISARQIVSAASDQYHWFPAGSGPQPGLKTAAKAEIWTNPARFKEAQDAFAAEAVAFQQTVTAGNVDAIRAEARKLGGTCKSCHDTFRVEQD